MIDLHNHILPGLDDGARDLTMSLAMARQAVDDGITAVAATPHRIRHVYWPTLKMRQAAYDRLSEALSARKIPLHIQPWTELYEDFDLAGQLDEPHLILGQTAKYCLLEFAPHDLPVYHERLLSDFFYREVTVVLAHPERNFGIITQPQRALELVQKGVLLQINSGSLTGMFGPLVQMTAELLLANKLVHIIASDAHDDRNRPLILSPAVECAAKIVGAESARAFVEDNTAKILNGQPFLPIIPESFQDDSFFRRLRRKWRLRFLG